MLDKFITHIENYVFQFIVDLIHLPFTVLKIFLNSQRCYTYAVRELDLPEEERFKNILSPIKLSIYATIILGVLLKNIGGLSDFVKKFSAVNMLEKFVLLFLVVNFTSISFSVILLQLKKMRVNSIEFRKILSAFIYSTTYSVAPFILLYSTVMLVFPKINIANYEKSFFFSDFWYKSPDLFSIIFTFFIGLIIIGAIKTFKAYYLIISKFVPNISVSKTFFISSVFYLIQIWHCRIFFS